jgi:hypothetical protein
MTAPVQPTSGTMTAAKLAALVALVQAQAALRQRLTRTAVAAALAPFQAFDGWWSPARVDRAVAEVLRVVQPTQRQMARVTDAYLAQAVSTMTGRRASPAGVVDVTRLRRQMTQQVAQDLVDGTREPAFVVLGEFDPNDGRVELTDRINEPIVLAIPDPVVQPSTAAVRRSTRSQAEELRARARDLARQLEALRNNRASPPPITPTRTPTAGRPATSVSTRTPTTPVTETAAADSVDPAEPYRRIAEQYRYQVVAQGATEEGARQRALVRVEAVAETDVTLAVREQVRRTIGRIPGIEGYRRVVRPELSETGPCGLCVVAADRLYHVEFLNPIHDRCVCEVLPVIGDMDPGLFLNQSDLDRIYRAAGGTGGDVIRDGRRHSGALKRIRVALAEHGELGPVLVDADQRYRGPRQVAATQVADRRTRARAQLASLEETFERLQRRDAAGEDVSRPMRWQSATIDRLERELAN